ncbi:MAG TPA: hypothetical protein VGL69_20745 [Solirubrobacteraceae bacterium]|jgi:hypothetical protein
MLRRVAPLVTAGALVLGVSACGSSGSHGSGSGGSAGPAASSNPTTLLRQTFASTHSIKSGVLGVSIVITPKGSSELTAPLSLTLGGPFQSSGGGQTAQSALTIAFSGLGKHGSLGVTTTGSAGYVTLEGTSYKLPSADFKKLQNSLGTHSGTGSEPGLSSFGINPQDWVTQPRIVGTATVDGAVTEHLHADVNVRAFVLSLNKVLAKESSTLRSAGSAAAKVPTHITSAEASKVAAAIHQPTVDVYTDKNDSSLRRLVIDATLPVHGSLSTQLGGLTSASIHLTVDYSHLNEPQTITAPAHAQNFTALRSKLEALGQGLTGSGLGSTGSSSSGSSAKVSKYAKCVQKASGDVGKMQKCAALLQNAG